MWQNGQLTSTWQCLPLAVCQHGLQPTGCAPAEGAIGLGAAVGEALDSQCCQSRVVSAGVMPSNNFSFLASSSSLSSEYSAGHSSPFKPTNRGRKQTAVFGAAASAPGDSAARRFGRKATAVFGAAGRGFKAFASGSHPLSSASSNSAGGSGVEASASASP